MIRKLSDVTDIIAGYAFKSKDFGPDFPDKVIKITHIVPPIVDMNRLSSVDISKYDRSKLEKYIAREGDYVFAMTGATIGKIGRIEKGEAYLNQRVMMFKPNSEIDKDFLYYILLQKNFYQYVLNHIDSESAQPNISAGTVAKYEFDLPDIEIQRKIGKVLRLHDEKIETNRRINENLLQQAQAILTSYFIDFSQFGGVVPDDWKRGTLQDIAVFSNGYAFKSKELLDAPEPNCYHVFKQGHINRGGGFNSSGTKSWYPKSKCAALSKYVLHKGDVLMAMTDMKDNVAILGNTALMTVDDQYIVNQRVGLLRSNGYKSTSYAYIYLLTNSFDFLKDLRSRANSGVQVNLSSSEIKASPVWIATDEVNKEFNALTEPLLSMIMSNDIENQRLAGLRDILLPRLMSGELDVSNLDI